MLRDLIAVFYLCPSTVLPRLCICILSSNGLPLLRFASSKEAAWSRFGRASRCATEQLILCCTAGVQRLWNNPFMRQHTWIPPIYRHVARHMNHKVQFGCYGRYCGSRRCDTVGDCSILNLGTPGLYKIVGVNTLQSPYEPILPKIYLVCPHIALAKSVSFH